LLDLQKEVIAFAARRGLPKIPLTVGPQQLYGIEINEYAHELAQVTAWIGYLQWRHENGFDEMEDPVLRPLDNIKRMDAILTHDDDGNPVEPEWPAAEVIVGNPPFLGGNKIRAELGDGTVDDLFKLYNGRVPAFADLVCYWFEKARAQIEAGKTGRAGLLATNSIRGGANRRVLERIKETGDIFMAWSDNPWILDGAAVRVSIVGFDDNKQIIRSLDGQEVSRINSDLTSTADLGSAQPLIENSALAYRGNQKGGSFDIPHSVAQQMLNDTQNPNGRPNSDVVKPIVNGIDITDKSRNMWLIDFGTNMSQEAAEQYIQPFKYVQDHVFPERKDNRRKHYRDKWWIHAEPRPGMRSAISTLTRFPVTPHVSKHRIWVWLSHPTIPDHQLIVVARSDDYFFGVLHARPHELWSLRMGTSLEDRPRYTPTTTFETYPFPWPPGGEEEKGGEGEGEKGALVADIARWARALVAWREAWLNPPPPAKGTLDVAWERLIKARTLTNLYNGLVYWREHKGPAFDRAAF
ncbi:MAG TPA: class I SAM-dependent DNA methyltransferase, partial [Promineifilum sp.]|nr:class I SAM-dependent DNA methyltransferase [Promineifilum sp.]